MVKIFLLLVIGALACERPSIHWPKVKPIVDSMSIEQLIGQMTQGDVPQLMKNNVVDGSMVSEYNLGSVLVGGNAVPDGEGHVSGDYQNMPLFLNGTLHNWRDLANRVNQPTTIGSYKIYPLLGTDAVHGNQHLIGAVLFPHNIGLAATHNPKHFKAAGNYTQLSVLEMGWNYAFAPTVAVSHNPYWGRHYETMGSDPKAIREYAQAYAEGLQADNGSGYWAGVLSSVKHFLGDGSTYWGVDEGNATVYNMQNFLKVNNAGYEGGKDACMGSVMISYSAINQVAMSINSDMIQGVLKEGLFDGKPFDGFAISDYDAVGKVSGQFWPTTGIKMPLETAIIMAINAGLDMIMLASTDWGLPIDRFQSIVAQAVAENAITRDRLEDAVTRILGVKCAMGLIEGLTGCDIKPAPTAQADKGDQNAEAIAAALEAARDSLVVLENKDDVLPLDIDDLKYIVLIGERDIYEHMPNWQTMMTTYRDYDNIGAQSGGWTVCWQGYNGNYFWQGENKVKSGATSILDAVLKRKSTQVFYNNYTDPRDMIEVKAVRQQMLDRLMKVDDMDEDNTLVIAVLSEDPYAEWMGDINDPFCWDPNNGGCMYRYHVSAYLPNQQATTLSVEMDGFSYDVLRTVRGKDSDIPVVQVIFSGRPVEFPELFGDRGAVIQAWLPGPTGGEAIASVVFGEKLLTAKEGSANTLPVDWVTSSFSLEGFPVYTAGDLPAPSMPKYSRGYGLSTTDSGDDDSASLLLAGLLMLILH